MWEITLQKSILFAVADHYINYRLPKCEDEGEVCRLRQTDRLCWDGAAVNALSWLVLRQLGKELWNDYQLELIHVNGGLTVLVKLPIENGQWLAVFPVWEMNGIRYNRSAFPILDKFRCELHRRKHPGLSYLAPYNDLRSGLSLRRLKEGLGEIRDWVSYTYYRLVLSSTLDGGKGEGRGEIPVVALFMADPEAFSKFFIIVSGKIDSGEWYREEELTVVCRAVEKMLEFIWAFKSGKLQKDEGLWWKQNIGYVNDIVSMITQCCPDDALGQEKVLKNMKMTIDRWHNMVLASCDRLFASGQLIPLADCIERRTPGMKNSESMRNIRHYQEELNRQKRRNPCTLNFGPTGPG